MLCRIIESTSANILGLEIEVNFDTGEAAIIGGDGGGTTFSAHSVSQLGAGLWRLSSANSIVVVREIA